ncbi:MAG: hypothetical protein ABI165_13530, partial [Bryobacteraceae bacterium]
HVANQQTTSIHVEYNGKAGNTVKFPVSGAVPTLFTADGTGVGPAAALNQDGSVNSAANPAAPGSVVVFYGTGGGLTTPAGVDGQVAGTMLLYAVQTATATVAGRDAQVIFAGAAPGFVEGVLQINVTLPADCPPGAAPVAIAMGGGASPASVSVWVR